ncbi:MULTISPECIES: LysR family transcriptional regulator [Pandoraea]|uniref:HTH-type transcriptional regulator BenM n=1 Tax=Pandoraea cepalis TaxID=2508294 RepID=A0A5E4RG44_9BURK|nr:MULTISPECIES: LysR family transcriptional regulator [Pandoraea]QBC30105.1 LysR family transcriptional regulator [Pandoraea sp. XY-2]VVD61813.1 HTH-type transcriptional regulator BenM [Pandoraea cepalis]
MRDIDLKTLRLFVAVCDHNNIGRAASEAHIEPSAISKRIAQMESDLGVTLLTRTRRGVQPTAAGLAVLENARSVLFTMERIASDAASFGGGLKGRVSLCASASAIAESLLDDISDFMSIPAHADIRVDVEERLSVDLVRRIREGAASVGVCWDNVALDGLQAVPYREDSLALAVHPAHPLAGRRSLSFHQSLDYDHVGMPPATAVHTLLQRAAANVGRTVTYRAVVSSFDAALRVVAANLGISVIPAEVGEIYQSSMKIKTIPLTDSWARRRFIICYRDFDTLPPAAQRMVEHLVERARAQS